MFFIQFLATPRKTARTAPNAAGAFVNCWIDRPTAEEAIQVARRCIEAEGWILDEPEMAHQVRLEDYAEDECGAVYYKQATLDKEVFVYHTFGDVDGATE